MLTSSIQGISSAAMSLRSPLGLLADLEPGAPVVGDRYRVVELLGRGTYGVVYSCRDLRLEREVAIKVGPSPSAPEPARRRFLREARMMAEVSDPGTVVVLDYGRLPETGHLYIVMERLRGGSLRARMDREGPMSLPDTRDIVGDVLMTLSAFHARGAVHRDLKPENVHLDHTEAGELMVKILDLGLARHEDQRDLITGEGERLGTPLYMAPELVRNGEVSHRSDLFAVATMTFEMLTGVTPVTRRADESMLRFMKRTVTEPRRRLRELRPDLPEAVEAAIARSLELDPARRHPDARALLADLARATGGESGSRAPRSWRLR